jgi:hypothetical protein
MSLGRRKILVPERRDFRLGGWHSVMESDKVPIELANGTVHELSASVFTEDLRRGLSVARNIEAGRVRVFLLDSW